MRDTDVLAQVQSVLLEPPDGGLTYPSGLWSAAEILAYLNERQDRFLKRTLYWSGLADLPATAGVGIYALPQDWLTTISATWIGSDGRVVPLVRADRYMLDQGTPRWATQQGRPQYYLSEDTPLLTIQIAPTPDRDGTLHLCYVPQGPTLIADGSPLTVTNEYAHAVGKYGVLADAFAKDGRGRSPERAAYCQQRYDLAIAMAEITLRGWT